MPLIVRRNIMSKFLLICLVLLSTDVLSQKKQIEFVDFLHTCLTIKEPIDLSNYGDYPDALFELGSITGYELNNANLILDDLTAEDLDFEEGQLLKYSMDHPIIWLLKKKYPDAPIEIDSVGRLIIKNNILMTEVSFEYFDLGNLHSRPLKTHFKW